MVLHDLNLASRFADRMIAIRGGRIIRHGPPEDVMTPAVLRETFRIAAEIVTDPRTNRPVCLSYNLL
jgi:iron complex transport system ATP-binding protein